VWQLISLFKAGCLQLLGWQESMDKLGGSPLADDTPVRSIM
jgi:hypothetical protein